MKLHPESHLDHGLSKEAIAFVLAKFADRQAFFVETFDLPDGMGELDCGLHGPLVGDAPVPEGEVFYRQRGDRQYGSRMCGRPARKTRTCTVVGGPEGGECILYTSYGGPAAPREPNDPNLPDVEREASAMFWAVHALSVS